MTPRSRVWQVVAVLFTLINLVSAVYAAMQAEPMHAGIHAVLVLVGVYLVGRLAPRREAGY
jgi:hypothetical protein